MITRWIAGTDAGAHANPDPEKNFLLFNKKSSPGASKAMRRCVMPPERFVTSTAPDRDIEAKMLNYGYIQRNFPRHHVSAPSLGVLASLMSDYAIVRSMVVTMITSAKKIMRVEQFFRPAPGQTMQAG